MWSHEEICSNAASTSVTCDSLSVSEGITLSLCLLCRSQSYQACLRFMLNELEPCFQDKPGSILLWDMQTRSIHITFAWMRFSSACEVHFIESIQREQPTPGIRFTDLFFLECFFSSWCCIDRVICGLSHVLHLWLSSFSACGNLPTGQNEHIHICKSKEERNVEGRIYVFLCIKTWICTDGVQ